MKQRRTEFQATSGEATTSPGRMRKSEVGTSLDLDDPCAWRKVMLLSMVIDVPRGARPQTLQTIHWRP